MEEKPNIGKELLLSTLVCACIAVVGQILVALYSFTPLYGQGLSIFFVLGTLCLLGAILFVLGIYPKIEKIGGMGAALPLCGLASAIGGATFGVGKATGSYMKGAKVPIVELLCKIVLIATALCCIIAVIMNFTGWGTVYTAPYNPGGILVNSVGAPWGTEPGPPMGVPYSFDPLSLLWAFITGAVVGLVFHAIFLLFKRPSLTIYFNILFVLGGLCAPLGIMKAIVQFGGGGMQVQIIGAGEAVVNTFFALLNGMPMPFIEVLILFVYIFVLGIVAGWIKLAMSKKDPAPAGGPEDGPAQH